MNDELIKKISIPYTSTIKQTLATIDKGAIGIALLHDDNSFHGLITDGDIRRALLNGYGLNTPIHKIDRPKTVTASTNTPYSKLLDMITNKIRCIPLIDKKRKVKDLFMFDKRSKIPVSEPQIGTKELQYVSECLLSGWVSSSGKFVQQFEKMYAEFCGAKYAVATSNGTTALHLALLSLNISKGDEVIVPALTFIATANAVKYTGAEPVFIDSEPETWNLDPNMIEKSITPRTKAIIPVHLYGHPANMDLIHNIASKHKLAVIEDAAQAHGALYKKRVGLINQTDVGCFSFFGNKILTTGEGGMAITNRQELFEKMKILRDHGMSVKQKYLHSVMGYNYRMTNIQAAIGVAQLEKLRILLKKTKLLNFTLIS
ncbi:MAG: perosamine synthetase [Candidatus Magnetoglobus multicellularis str. Araruama]|uniref:GDP-perosamine synthase n=1 Tax=Candidatus Magnetoglobus multicellularis str. Araruama TaxID=890399 RepID=A0A1V1P9K5_9BACT|nr:MAG: perosamine synthetase [Candidatus Magnetoglobus multicellularis str. Araruama]